MQTEEVEVSIVKPGDLVETYNGMFYIKNIYTSAGDVTSYVEEVFGTCVTIEYTDDKSKCNNSYVEPELQFTKLDYSVQTPSIYPLKSKIIRINQ